MALNFWRNLLILIATSIAICFQLIKRANHYLFLVTL